MPILGRKAGSPTRGHWLLSPSDSTAHIASIMVPVDGSEASMQAVALACDIARRNKGRVYTVHVIEVKRALPIDADMAEEAATGEQVLAQADEVARGWGVKVEGELLQARDAGHAIVDEAADRGVDAIVIGKQYRRAPGEYELGTIIDYVLRQAECEVWVRRLPQQE